MYQPDFPPVPFRLGLYPVVDSVAWIERLARSWGTYPSVTHQRPARQRS